MLLSSTGPIAIERREVGARMVGEMKGKHESALWRILEACVQTHHLVLE